MTVLSLKLSQETQAARLVGTPHSPFLLSGANHTKYQKVPASTISCPLCPTYYFILTSSPSCNEIQGLT